MTNEIGAPPRVNGRDIGRVNVLGVGVHAVAMAEAVALVRAALDAGERREDGYVCFATVYGVMEAQRDGALRRAFNRALLTLPDGMPTVWMGWAEGERTMDRVYGPDFMLDVLRDGVASGRRHFLYGGREGQASELKARLEVLVPNVQIAGIYTPPFRPLTPDEEADFAAQVAASKADVVWVGLGSPKQDRFCEDHAGKVDATLLIGVGAAFDFHTGRAKDAPSWMKRAGLQWVHRLAQDPRRLAGRYLVNNPVFVAKALLQLAGVARYSIDGDAATSTSTSSMRDT